MPYLPRLTATTIVCALSLVAVAPLQLRAQSTVGLELIDYATGLTRPVAARHARDGSGRLYVVQQHGSVRIVEANGTLNPNAYLTLNTAHTTCEQISDSSDVVLGFTTPANVGDERGFLGLDFHPNYSSNGFVFASFSDGRGDTAIVRYTRDSGNPDIVDPNSCRVILRVDQDFSNHNGGDIHFGPDGYLYIGLGDGGSSNDPCNRAQTLTPGTLTNAGGSCPVDNNFVTTGDGNAESRALLGKMVRIDVDNTTPAGTNQLCADFSNGSAAYAIPTGARPNPFAGNNGVAGACDETWAYGLRNPWRWSFDSVTGDLLIGDVGQFDVEEVDFESAAFAGGGNYGWKGCEGTSPVNGGSCASTIAPILTYTHASGCSITGGYRYRGGGSTFYGAYVYGDACTRDIFVATENAGNWSTTLWFNGTASSYNFVAFGEAEDGRVFVIDHAQATADAGKLIEIRPPQTLYANGFE